MDSRDEREKKQETDKHRRCTLEYPCEHLPLAFITILLVNLLLSIFFKPRADDPVVHIASSRNIYHCLGKFTYIRWRSKPRTQNNIRIIDPSGRPKLANDSPEHGALDLKRKMSLPNPSVDEWQPGPGAQALVPQEEDDRKDGVGITRTTTIWEDDNGKKDVDDGHRPHHQVAAVSAGDLGASPPRVKLTEEDVSNTR